MKRLTNADVHGRRRAVCVGILLAFVAATPWAAMTSPANAASGSAGATQVLATVAQANSRNTIAAGGFHSLVVKTDGTLWTFGDNSYGQLGRATLYHFDSTPTQVMSGVSAAAGGQGHSVVLKTDGTLWTFGRNNDGQLGTATNNRTFYPNPIPTQVMTEVNAMAAGDEHTLVLKTDGTLWTFGFNNYGELGNTANVGQGSLGGVNWMPTLVMTGVKAMAAGEHHSIVLKTDGTVWTFGYNRFGQLGFPMNIGTSMGSPTPTQVMTGATAIAAGAEHTLVLKTDGTLWSFGDNYSGQLGTTVNFESNVANPTPTQVMAGVTAVAARATYSLALTLDGTLSAVGTNPYIGATAKGAFTTPTPVMTGVSAMAAGVLHVMGLKPDGTLWTLGGNPAGELGTTTNEGTDSQNRSPIQVMTGVLQPGGRPIGSRVSAGESVCVAVGGTPGDYVVANATITGPVADGFATVHSPGADWRASSTNNFVTGASLPNLTITRIGDDGKICMTADTATHMIIDVTGFLKASTITPVSTVGANRILDTRSS